MSQKVRRILLVSVSAFRRRGRSPANLGLVVTIYAMLAGLSVVPAADLVAAQGYIAADLASRHLHRDLDHAVRNRQCRCGSLKPDHTVLGASGDADILHACAIGDGRCH